MDKPSRIIIVGAGVFGLSTAAELAREGYRNILVLDRHVPPVPDGSSADISRVIRFDYGDATYTKIANESYDTCLCSPVFQDAFFSSPFALMASGDNGRQYKDKCTQCLDQLNLQWENLPNAKETRSRFPVLYQDLPQASLSGYCNQNAGWADAQKAIAALRNYCIETGVSFDSSRQAKMISGHKVCGDLFILSAGAWSLKLVAIHNSTTATRQVLSYIKLTPEEMLDLKNLPIYINFDSGWFYFPPYVESGLLKIAIHGRGYTRTDSTEGGLSTPPMTPRRMRANFVPEDGLARLRAGLQEILPAFAHREFDRVAVCWYSDTPSGDFIIDNHPEHANLFIATGGSEHAFNFLPVLGKYIVQGLIGSLPRHLTEKWSFRTEYKNMESPIGGDGNRGGPERREFTAQEKARL